MAAEAKVEEVVKGVGELELKHRFHEEAFSKLPEELQKEDKDIPKSSDRKKKYKQWVNNFFQVWDSNYKSFFAHGNKDPHPKYVVFTFECVEDVKGKGIHQMFKVKETGLYPDTHAEFVDKINDTLDELQKAKKASIFLFTFHKPSDKNGEDKIETNTPSKLVRLKLCPMYVPPKARMSLNHSWGNYKQQMKGLYSEIELSQERVEFGDFTSKIHFN